MNAPHKIYELRIYSCLPGKLAIVAERFPSLIFPYWQKHGIQQVGFWTVEAGSSNHDLIFMIAWDSLAERERIWTAFTGDPDWQRDLAQSEPDGPLIANIRNQFLKATAFSAIR